MAALSFASPTRVLDRMKLMEEAELPSLPSIMPNLDYDSHSGVDNSGGYEGHTGQDMNQSDSEDDMQIDDEQAATPHPNRRHHLATSHLPPSTSASSDTSLDGGHASSSLAPFPPLPARSSSGSSAASTPYLPARSGSRRYVSDDHDQPRGTPATACFLGQSRNSSDTGYTSRFDRSETFHTPGEMSRSFSGEPILPRQGQANDSGAMDRSGGSDGEMEMPSLPDVLGEEFSVAHNDQPESQDGDVREHHAGDSLDQSIDSLPAETPLRRFSRNVVLNRPGRRSQSLLASSQGRRHTEVEADVSIPSPIEEGDTPSSTYSRNPGSAHIQGQDRVPSLTKSEGSTDTSHAATTPEGPVRHAPIATPSFSRSLQQEGSLEIIEHPTESRTSPTVRAPTAYTRASPPAGTPTTVYSTPGIGRDPVQMPGGMNAPSTYRASPITNIEGLSDMTDRFRRSLNTPFTPSPGSGKGSDYSTPRAPLDDSERRKSHVLSVLASTGPNRRQRTPHPLRRVSMSPDDSPIAEQGGATPHANRTPYSNGGRTPLSRALDRSGSAPPDLSMVSVTSSADLTTDRRAVAASHSRLSRGNTSFPTMFLGGANTSAQSSVRVSSDRRADGIKIQKHLNAMNKQLLETNADLAREAEAWKGESERLKGLLREAGIEVEDVDVEANISLSKSQSRDNSFTQSRSPNGSIDSRIENSAQRVVANMSPQDQAKIMDDMAREIENLEEMLNDKDAQIVEMQEQLDERQVNDYEAALKELQEQLDQAHKEKADLHADFAAKTAEYAQQFAEISETLEQQVADLQDKLKSAEAEVEDLRAKAASHESERIEQLQGDVDALRDELDKREEELADVETKYAESADLAADLEARLQETESALKQAKEAREMEINEAAATENSARAAQILELQEQLRDAEVQTETHRTEADQLRDEVDELNRVLEERNAEVEGLEGKLQVAELAAQAMRQSLRSSQGAGADTRAEASEADQASFVAAMEERLDEAYREIGRLKHELASSPQRKATMEAKDAKIKALEREKATLVARQKSAVGPPTPASLAKVSLLGKSMAGTPTPLFNKALRHLHTPRTPGSMKELSWLNTTVGDANEPILRAQVEYLQTELDKVNGQLDSNFSRLEEAGLGSVALAEKLAAAQARIGELEDEIRGLLAKDKSAMVDVYMQRQAKSEADQERLQNALADVHEQLDSVRSNNTKERSRLRAEIDTLKKALAELTETSDKEIERMRQETLDALDAAHGDVDKAKEDAVAATRETADVQRDLDSVRSNLRTLERDLERAKGDYDDLHRRHVRHAADSVPTWELQQKETSIKRLESELRIAREDRASLEADYSARLRREEATAAKATAEVVNLKAERARVTLQIEAFDADLAVQMTEAAKLKGYLEKLRDNEHAMQTLKGDLERVEAERSHARAEVQGVERELRRLTGEVGEMRMWKDSHACGGDTTKALEDQRARFKAQARELAAQIRYLKAKYTRESTFRNGLALQKRYLLLLVGGMSLNEQATLKAIAQMGYPQPEPPRAKRTFKAVGIAVLATLRATKAADSWKAEKEVKAKAAASFADRRR